MGAHSDGLGNLYVIQQLLALVQRGVQKHLPRAGVLGQDLAGGADVGRWGVEKHKIHVRDRAGVIGDIQRTHRVAGALETLRQR